MQLWPLPHSVVITEVGEWPRSKKLCFVLTAGRLDELKPVLPVILAWGKERGCDGAYLIGRAGWLRSFLTKEAGWKQSPLVILETTLK